MSAGTLVVSYPLTGRSRAIVAEELGGAAEAIYLVHQADRLRMGDGMDCLPGMRAVEASMPGKSKLTADAAEQAVLRALSKSEHRGEADRARAILLTLEGRRPGRSPRFSGCMSARCATGGVTLRMAGWRGCGGARGRDSRPRSGRMPGRSRRRS